MSAIEPVSFLIGFAVACVLLVIFSGALALLTWAMAVMCNGKFLRDFAAWNRSAPE
jgi:hypothetical protein